MTPVEARKPKKDWRSTPVFTDITREARAFLEAACNVRYFEEETCLYDGHGPNAKVTDRWTSTHSVQVKPVARHFGNCGVVEYVIADGYDACDLEYLKRCGMKPKTCNAPPDRATGTAFCRKRSPKAKLA